MIGPRNRKRGSRRKFADKSLWKRNARKKLRNCGREYISVRGTIVAAKQFDGSPCQCVKECHKLLTLEHREKLFKDFHELGSHDLQTAYLCGQIKLIQKLTRTVPRSEYRTNTRVYYLTNDAGIDIPVCREFFKKKLRVSDGRITCALRQKEQEGTPSRDKRGKKAPYNKTSTEKIETVITFIAKFPKYQSHYSRKKSKSSLLISYS